MRLYEDYRTARRRSLPRVVAFDETPPWSKLNAAEISVWVKISDLADARLIGLLECFGAGCDQRAEALGIQRAVNALREIRGLNR